MLDILGPALKAEPVFAENGWTYGGEDQSPEWPELAMVIYELAMRVETDREEQGVNFQESRWASGRFEVRCFRNDGEDAWDVMLHLSNAYVDTGEELFS